MTFNVRDGQRQKKVAPWKPKTAMKDGPVRNSSHKNLTTQHWTQLTDVFIIAGGHIDDLGPANPFEMQ